MAEIRPLALQLERLRQMAREIANVPSNVVYGRREQLDNGVDWDGPHRRRLAVDHPYINHDVLNNSLDIPSDSNIGFDETGITDCVAVKYSNYVLNEIRLKTFDIWPKQLRQRPQDLSMSGFFYSGKGDITICHSCGIHIQSWEPEDIPLDEHMRWVSKLNLTCEYIQRVGEIAKKNPEREIHNESGDLQPEQIKNNDKVNVLCDENTCEDTPFACTVCLTNKIEVLYKPCKHVASCLKCAINLDKCPVCRADVTNFQRVYLP